MSNTEKFSGKAAIYAQFRPNYPEALIRDLINEHNLDKSSVIADIGSGTGILTRQLVEHDLRVKAVEPNTDMRHVAESSLGTNPLFTSVAGMAEHTTLQDGSVDLITVAQAFHWFDPETFKEECRRILKKEGQVVLVWNSRIPDASLIQESEKICEQFCPDFDGFSGGLDHVSSRFKTFFQDGKYQCKTYDHPLYYHLEEFIGRHLSASYAPKEPDLNYLLYIEALTRLFQKYSIDDLITFPNMTRSYSGQV
ncbi:class I SAM-dependent methyltransferase [Sporolactobacillus pectinivorans]|uniref:class I SAM-dependent methyltransferase n=1 Tax=Sporolactobacillus pectinivorans TaxID=1591408 RepID=UPI000C25DC2F|nr:class I SAM-dependent methyltransferase [Sporolactobacillus pectinivorans]